MIRRTIKLVVLVTVVVGVVGYGVFGSDVGSYFETLLNMGRRAARENVPLEFELQRARDLTDQIQTDAARMLQTLSRYEVSAETLEKQIERSQAAAEGLRRQLIQAKTEAEQTTQSGETSVEVDAANKKADARLAVVFRLYKLRKEAIAQQDVALDKKREAIVALRDRLVRLRTERIHLAAQIETLEATIQSIRASEDYSDSDVNDTLAKTREILNEVESRTRVLARVAENRREFLAPAEHDEASEVNELSDSPAEVLLTVEKYLHAEEQSRTD